MHEIGDTLVVGIGQRFAGDDGLGPAVVAELRRRGVERRAVLSQLDDPGDLVSLLAAYRRVVLIDAVVSERHRVGTVLRLAAEELATRSVRPLSSHGIDVATALDLGGRLAPPPGPAHVTIIGVVCPPPRSGTQELSEEVAQAVARAASLVEAELGQPS